MSKKIFAVLLTMLMLFSIAVTFVSAETLEEPISIKSASYDTETETLAVTVANISTSDIANFIADVVSKDSKVSMSYDGNQSYNNGFGSIAAGNEKEIIFKVKIDDYDASSLPKINCQVSYIIADENIDLSSENVKIENILFEDILNTETGVVEAIVNFLNQTGFAMLAENWKVLIMLVISFVLLYLAIVKQFEPLLLLPIAFGMLLTNLPGAEMFHEELFADGHAHWNLFNASNAVTPGLLDYLYLGVKLGIYPCLIFFGVGAMTDFEPLIANPKSLLLGAAAQGGIFITFIGARLLGFTPAEAGSIGIIGGADGPTAIFVTTQLAPWLLGPIAVAAYSYMALVPVIQPPIMKALTTKKERTIVMKPLRKVSKKEKVIFPIVVTAFVALLVPSAASLVGALMLGNLFKESGVTERLSKTVQNELMNIVTIFLGVTVGATATADTFLTLQTIKIIVMGVVAFGVATSCGVLLAKLMNVFLKEKINPLIGSAGVSAVPMAARVSQKVGQAENPKNFLLMHAMGPNVAGVIGSAVAAGVFLALYAK